ncbi:phytanoyl-CoA dioxygenase [Shewanella sp. OPT22]|nr:phytanoyl-CoA dioxygenase [Shewanella sp. OPT22]
MKRSLTNDQISNYKNDGFVFPIKIFSEAKASDLKEKLQAIEQQQKKPYSKAQSNKSYLLYDWADELVNHPAILDAIESLIGKDIICLMTNLFIKEPGSKSFVSMHQDAAYWGVKADDVVTAWVALSPATRTSGVMKVEPGSHHHLQKQMNTYSSDNLLSRGQTIPDRALSPSNNVYMELAPGEMSLHHFKLVHGSDPNNSDERRIGFAIRYVAAKASVKAHNQSGLLVRGTNKSNIKLERRVTQFNQKERNIEHAKAMRRLVIVMLSSGKETPPFERVRLFALRWGAICYTYWRQIMYSLSKSSKY